MNIIDQKKREEFRAECEASWQHFQETGLHATGEEVHAWLLRLAAGEVVPPPECHK